MTKPFVRTATLEQLIERMSKRMKSAFKEGKRANFNARILNLIDEKHPEILRRSKNRFDYQCNVAALIENHDPDVAEFVGDIDEESFTKACKRSGRTFPERTPPGGVDSDS